MHHFDIHLSQKVFSSNSTEEDLNNAGFTFIDCISVLV